MRRAHSSTGSLLAAGLLAAGPVVLAFLSGGYFDGPRTWALVGVGAVLALLAATAPARSLRLRSASGIAAVGGLVALAGWVALSREWSPVPGVASDDAERTLLYGAFLAAGAVAWRARGTARLAEPAVTAGITVVLLYGLAGRWLPGIVEQKATAIAGGRLDQPLTYWNATGMLAALGAVLAMRIAGDGERRTGLRLAAAGAAVPLLSGIYLSFSRGALVALFVGVLVLLLCAPTRSQVLAVAMTGVTGAVAVATSAVLPGVRALEGSPGARERDGLVAMAVTLAAVAAAVTLMAWAARREERTGAGAVVRVPAAVRWLAAAAIIAAVVLPVLASREGPQTEPRFGATSERFASVQSNRYAYWRVAVEAARDHPLAGVGSGGWGAEWVRERRFDESARDAHSIELETLAELGVVGFALLLVAFGGLARCAVVVQRRDPGLAAGASAGLAVWLTHASLDWDWEMPAATLPALTLAAVLIARAQAPDGPAPARAPRVPADAVAAEER